mmetsp:Transcript_17847/g.24695  ORF Transcript_17847/g.24695 Transcript_17847/m.24695 type:complete len:351 (-) Transcript_17847:138-1190(-)|eukprot:CAMPEP_0196579946 /NCGR_PEP_ID=MMETSP1081-20130531/25880_1 /TAXON_ID=36882 /ORGANISM="Pyramimonas amylifera, Strain CCMP720" /LENGTH=350 /DNA_ID=CAMNT_0041899677 /DNA_START=51 /DNA_END=1103 /DNA_ORIENTATION=-
MPPVRETTWDGLFDDASVHRGSSDRLKMRETIKNNATSIKAKLSKSSSAMSNEFSMNINDFFANITSSSPSSVFEGLSLLTKNLTFLRGKVAAILALLLFMGLLVEIFEGALFQAGSKTKRVKDDVLGGSSDSNSRPIYGGDLIDDGCPLGAICYGPKSTTLESGTTADYEPTRSTAVGAVATFPSMHSTDSSSTDHLGFSSNGPGMYSAGSSSASSRIRDGTWRGLPRISLPSAVSEPYIPPNVVHSSDSSPIRKVIKKPVPSRTSSTSVKGKENQEALKKIAREKEQLAKEKQLLERERDAALREKRKSDRENQVYRRVAVTSSRREKHARDVARAARTGWTPPKHKY